MERVRQQPEPPTVRLRRAAVLLGIGATILWLIALALPVGVLLLIGSLPGEDPARTERSHLIAFGAFLTFAIPAVSATVGVVLVRRARTRATVRERPAD
jgi:hypothetical protein